MSYGLYFLISVLITLSVEIPVLFFTDRYALKLKVQSREILYCGVFINLFSLPYLWFVFPLFISPHNYILVGEVLVVLIESVILLKVLKINFKNAFSLSMVANVASYLVGIIVLR